MKEKLTITLLITIILMTWGGAGVFGYGMYVGNAFLTGTGLLVLGLGSLSGLGVLKHEPQWLKWLIGASAVCCLVSGCMWIFQA